MSTIPRILAIGARKLWEISRMSGVLSYLTEVSSFYTYTAKSLKLMQALRAGKKVKVWLMGACRIGPK